MNRARADKMIRVAYWVFLTPIGLLFLSAIYQALYASTGNEESFLIVFFLLWFYFQAFLGLPLMFVFLGLNIARAKRESDKRKLFLIISVLLTVHNGFFLYWVIDWYNSGMIMP